MYPLATYTPLNEVNKIILVSKDIILGIMQTFSIPWGSPATFSGIVVAIIPNIIITQNEIV